MEVCFALYSCVCMCVCAPWHQGRLEAGFSIRPEPSRRKSQCREQSQSCFSNNKSEFWLIPQTLGPHNPQLFFSTLHMPTRKGARVVEVQLSAPSSEKHVGIHMGMVNVIPKFLIWKFQKEKANIISQSHIHSPFQHHFFWFCQQFSFSCFTNFNSLVH